MTRIPETITQAKATKASRNTPPRPGEILRNGRIAIAYRNGVVLALLPGSATPYATWAIGPTGTTWQGDYHADLNEAVAAFDKRAGA